MNPKEENEKLLQENAALIKTNAGISESINASKLALEIATRQEAEGRTVLLELSDEVVEKNELAKTAKVKLDKLNSEIDSATDKKVKIELSIIEAQSEAAKKHKEIVAKQESELEQICSQIQTKRSELTEITNKTVAEKSKLDLIILDIKNASDQRDVLNAQVAGLELQIKDKKRDLVELTSNIDTASDELSTIKKISKDTKVSTEAYEDRKTGLLAEIGSLNDELNIAKTSIAAINTEITELEVKRQEKEAEYNGSVSKIFDLKRREEAVSEREEYAKEQFKAAGLQY